MPARAEWTWGVEPMFLVGAPRSGTTWLQSLLACHWDVYTGPETHFFRSYEPVRSAFMRTRDRPLGPAEYWTRDQFFGTIKAQFWSLISQLPEPETPPKYFLEKTPPHVRHVPFILDVFPKARFIHLIRDGRDVSASCLRISKSWGQWAPPTAAGGAAMWLKHVERGRAIPDEITARGGDREKQYREVYYEAVKEDALTETTALFEWLDLDASTFHLPAHFESIPTIGKNTNTLSASHYPEGFVDAAARQASPSKKGLTRTQRLIAEAVAGQLLRELGYATGRAPTVLPASGTGRRIGMSLIRRVDSVARRINGVRRD